MMNKFPVFIRGKRERFIRIHAGSLDEGRELTALVDDERGVFVHNLVGVPDDASAPFAGTQVVRARPFAGRRAVEQKADARFCDQ